MTVNIEAGSIACQVKDPVTGRWEYNNPTGAYSDGLPPGSVISTLWIGNSLTNTPVDFNDYAQGPLPARIVPMLAEFGITMTYASRIQGGAEFATHAANVATMADISSGAYDFINLQGYYDGFASTAAYLTATQSLYEAAGAAGSKVLFEGMWPYLGDPGSPQHPAAANAVEGAADSVPYAFAVQVGRAWARVLEVNSALHAKLRSDSTHQSAAGEYLNALVYTRFFTARSVVNVSSISSQAAAQLSITERDILKAAVDYAVTIFYNAGSGIVPTIEISSPVNDQIFNAGSQVTFTAQAMSGASDVSGQIKWYQDGVEVHTGATFSQTPAIGRYNVTASVTVGDATVSVVRQYRVLNLAAGNTPPTVSDRSQNVPYGSNFLQVNLAGSATDLESEVDWSTLQLDISGFAGITAAQNGTDPATVDFDYSNGFVGVDQILWRVADDDGLYSSWAQINLDVQAPGLIRTGYYVGVDALPQVSPPAIGTVLDIPEYNTQLVRITDISNVNGGDPTLAAATFARHSYSRVCPWNANETYFQAECYSGWHVIIDASDYSIIHRISHPEFPASNAENHWHPTDPDLYLYGAINGGLVFRAHSVSSNSQSVYFDLTSVAAVRQKLGATSIGTSVRTPFPTAARARWRAEGQPSRDGARYFFQIEDVDFNFLGLISYDRVLNEIVSYLLPGDVVTNYGSGPATMTVPTGYPDHSSTSMTGDFGVASWDNDIQGTWAFKFEDLSKGVKLLNNSQHSDLGLMPSGRDVYVAWAQSNDAALYPGVGDIGGRIVATEFTLDASGNPSVHQRIRLSHLNGYASSAPQEMATVVHISAQASEKPGYFVLSTYGVAENVGGQKCFADHKILVCQIADNGDVLHVGPTLYSGLRGYWGEVQASANRSLTKIAFTSDWRGIAGTNSDLDDYIYILPTNAVRDL